MQWNKVYHGDSDVILPQIEKEQIVFDLILTDPPYNLNKDFGNTTDQLSFEDFLSATKSRLSVCYNLLSNNGSIIWFGIHNYIGYIQVMMYELGLYYRRMNIWHYENGFSRSKKAPATQYEPFLWFSKSNQHWTYNADDIRVPYKSISRLKTPVYYSGKDGTRKAWRPNPNGSLRSDIWPFPTLAGKRFAKEKTEHPTQKPEALIMELIKAYCPKNLEGQYEGAILDPFHGSGTLGVCCEKLNRQGNNIKWIGIELEQKWCDIANQRLMAVLNSDRNV